MKIAVNAACLRRDLPADTGAVATQIIVTLCRQQPEHQFILFFDGPVPAGMELPPNVTPVVLPLRGEKAWHLYWWLEWQLPRAMKAFQPDLYLGLDGTLPLRSKIPATLLIRDLSFLLDAGLQSVAQQKRLKKNLMNYLWRARSIAVLSETGKEAVLDFAPSVAPKLTVLDIGLSDLYKPLEWDDREAVKREFAGGAEYFLVTAGLHPRNNIMPLFKAFSALKRRQLSSIKLVIAGSATAAGAEIARALPSYKFRNDVNWIQDADLETLAKLTGGAYALIYPVRLDGLALPVYAAQQCQVPVVAIEGKAALEAAGDAALFSDPADLDDLSDKMSRIYKDEQLRSLLLTRIPPQKAFNSWEKAAEELWTAMTGPVPQNP
ncbi:Glycosyltransferase involved in cell wall bisynthesis [Chitinophaga jiangningensis]|uniref:Glycosyltransferase involved in cell wall bisynthesis n=1 Tax=Chitinophaga jiangningensis TaxID=1419482 RepID=A0A1M7HMP0_9BACT|nr:glycosyltransferase [Chitinophaga jiangningensis]SHM29724.1 Glycosyltransferase involved in cell wall bisynthesis [Chitinophaga jiangningensis]